MKGLVVESAGKICLHDDLPLPEIDEYQVLCRNVGCGICNGTDMQLINGQMPFIQYPFVLGHEAVGQVVAVAGWALPGHGQLVDAPALLAVAAVGHLVGEVADMAGCAPDFGVADDGGV